MAWSCWLNRALYPQVEQIFESIADTRAKLLQDWTASQWQHLAELAESLGQDLPPDPQLLKARLEQMLDLSELFLVDTQGCITTSTWAPRCGARDQTPEAVARGLLGPFLHGPYSDAQTLAIGPSTSRFHDAVPLMFYQPLKFEGRVVGCLCGRVPNDVLGDLIQREAGHIYPESGDNYLFMVDSRFDASIQAGTALSRSRFEDATFTHGENLKQGVHIAFGTV
ncbi:chemotaxis protein [Pseudomonas sp. TCU-HL1]|nr:chemotaxis protein [Pseudomonas sp. TCU-HL1]